VWNAAISHIRYDTGEIMAGRERLAEDAETTPEHASHALVQLVEIGALTRLRRGRYAINPHAGWTGDLMKRQDAAKAVPPVRAVEPDSVA
jgi:predicted transcriptional regulator of viral defense system